MTFLLTHSSLDEDEETSEHPTMEAAIAAAEAWFRQGYAEMLPRVPDLDEDCENLRSDLATSGEYAINRFYERIKIVSQ